jgi:hypothetical protein
MHFLQRLLPPARNTLVIMVDGGLGSQINKYLLGFFLKNKLRADILFDLDWYDIHGKSLDGANNRHFDLLRVFPGLKLKIASPSEIRHVRKRNKYVNPNPFVFDKAILSLPLPSYIGGYFFHWKTHYDLDLTMMKFSADLVRDNHANLEQLLAHSNPVAVHVRRGDYLNTAHDVLDEEYFLAAIDRMTDAIAPASPFFVFFSNDPEWVRGKLLPRVSPAAGCCVMDCNDNDTGRNDFYLMTQCRHHICSNSGFSYFSALLNRSSDKKVIIPRVWMKSGEDALCLGAAEAARHPGWLIV